MKKYIAILAFGLITQIGYCQNPYAMFGSDAPVLKSAEEKLIESGEMEIINADTLFEVRKIKINFLSNVVHSYSKSNQLLNSDTVSKEMLLRWIGPDVVNRFPSPYIGMGNNPILYGDPDGADIIVMNASKGAIGGAGHNGLLIGNDETGWTFISKEGRNKSPWYSNEFTGGPALQPKVITAKTLNAMLNHKGLREYDRGIRFKTSVEQDNIAISKAMKEANSWYQFCTNNCAHVGQSSLEKFGYDPGYTWVDNNRGGKIRQTSFVPNIIYGNMIRNNFGRYDDITNFMKEVRTLPKPAYEGKTKTAGDGKKVQY